MSGDVTARDRIWSKIIKLGIAHTRFEVYQIQNSIEEDARPSEETIRRVLRAGTELDVIEHTEGSPYYSLKDEGQLYHELSKL